MTDLDLFKRGFLEALYFADTGEDGQPSADALIANDDWRVMEKECEAFWNRYGDLILLEGEPAQAGNDFYFTRRGHGVGFWDGDWPRYGDTLTNACKAMGDIEIYEGDDGFIYIYLDK